MAGLAHTSTIPCKSVLHPTHLEPLRKMTHGLEEALIRLPDAQDWKCFLPQQYHYWECPFWMLSLGSYFICLASCSVMGSKEMSGYAVSDFGRTPRFPDFSRVCF